jgi:hypothetical protein
LRLIGMDTLIVMMNTMKVLVTIRLITTDRLLTTVVLRTLVNVVSGAIPIVFLRLLILRSPKVEMGVRSAGLRVVRRRIDRLGVGSQLTL